MKTRSKSRLFLIELMIAFLFFLLGCVVCVRMFLTAHTLSEKSELLDLAVVAAQSAAEVYQSGGTELLIQMTSAVERRGSLIANFDERGAYGVGEFSAVFDEEFNGDTVMLSIEIFEPSSQQPIFDMTTAFYNPVRPTQEGTES